MEWFIVSFLLCIFIFCILIHNFIALAWNKTHREFKCTRLTRIHNIILPLGKKIKIAFYQTESYFLFLYTEYSLFRPFILSIFYSFIFLRFVLMQIIMNIIHKHTMKPITVAAVDRNARGRWTKRKIIIINSFCFSTFCNWVFLMQSIDS